MTVTMLKLAEFVAKKSVVWRAEELPDAIRLFLNNVRLVVDPWHCADQYIVQDPATRAQLLSELSQIESSEQPIVFLGSAGKLGTLPDLREYTNWQFPKESTSPEKPQ